MKIVFFGDSITDMGRNREVENGAVESYGDGYVFLVAAELLGKDPNQYEIVNRGINGSRIYDLYARLKKDVWNEEPDVVSILIGINDVDSERNKLLCTDEVRFEKIYRMLIEETREKLPNVRFILCAPFHLYISEELSPHYSARCRRIPWYEKLIKQLAEEYGCKTVFLQSAFEEKAAKFGADKYVPDGTHPSIMGAKIIADEWLKVFKEMGEA
ncbi:MAG: SGNH/GDSL hydrolase family protein [Clostridia bacterium]|nr:SGNH/GDSL hydrolase family protein [Clostridia bacterium]